MEKSIAELQAENISKVIEDGPSLRYGYNHWIVAKDTANKQVLVGGLGSFGIGEMWCTERERHKEYPGYSEAPERQTNNNIIDWSKFDLEYFFR